MDASVGSTIEKIKRDEQLKEAKLKAKREQEAAKSALERAVRDVLAQVKRLKQEAADLSKKNIDLRVQVTIQQTRRDALKDQLAASTKELHDLQAKADKLNSAVQEIRSAFCKAVQDASDECGVWALLSRPPPDAAPCVTKTEPSEVEREDSSVIEQRLKNAIERRDKAIAERERLKSEPEMGEEFIRTFLLQNRNNRTFSSKVGIEPAENEPIKFSTSPAAQKTIKPVMTKQSTIKNMPWYQPYSVIGSVAVFLIYFCLLREENDVDQEFTKTLYQRIKGLEKEQLLQSYKFNKEQGKSVSDIEARLKELELEEQRTAAA